jgi:hypothetical protein
VLVGERGEAIARSMPRAEIIEPKRARLAPQTPGDVAHHRPDEMGDLRRGYGFALHEQVAAGSGSRQCRQALDDALREQNAPSWPTA